ncbi:MAG: heavy metal translocating P-type ATPase, partial [Cytophagales bacterium]|nr:heavy metal translocating P-type ATPase [Cytophagales bacterium]
MTTTRCYHCGEPCAEGSLEKDQHSFCCVGCQTVYDLLYDKGLCEYYSLAQSPGIRLQSPTPQARFRYLDHCDIQTQLLDYRDGERARLRFFLPQIHCSSCIWLLEHLHRLNPAVLESRVHFGKKEIALTYLEQEIKLSELVGLLSSMGYEPRIQLADGEKKDKPPIDKKLYYQVGVAGFCFGNIMLMSLPHYLPGADQLALEFRHLFGYLSLVMCLPSLFYAGQDYLLSAWASLRQRQLNLDVPIALGSTFAPLRQCCRGTERSWQWLRRFPGWPDFLFCSWAKSFSKRPMPPFLLSAISNRIFRWRSVAWVLRGRNRACPYTSWPWETVCGC